MHRPSIIQKQPLARTGLAFAMLTLAACDPSMFLPPEDEPTPVEGWDERVPADDNDGVPAERDFCPETLAGAEVDDNGCSASQEIEDGLVPDSLPLVDVDEDGYSRKSEAVLRSPPATGQRHKGFVALVGAPDEDGPVVLFAHESAVTERDGEVDVDGPVALATSDGFLVMREADLTLDLDEEGDVSGIDGEAHVPLPDFGLLGGAEVTGFQTAVVGFDRGSNLEELEAPLAPERRYLYFRVASEAGFRVGPMSYAKSGPDATVVYDPTDPFIFLRGDLVGLGSLGPLEDVGLGLSFGGHIPFEPEIDPERFEAFRGHAYVEGALSISSIPIALEGNAVLELPSESLYSTEGTLGANGTLAYVAEIFGIFKVDLELAESTTIVASDNQEVRATFSGLPARNFLNEGPISDDSSFIRGVVSTKLEDSWIEADGNFGLDGVWMTAHTPLVVSDIPLLAATARIDATGAHITGRVDLVPELPGVILHAGVEAEVFIPQEADYFTITFRGEAEIEGVFEANAEVVLGPGGVTVGVGG